MSSKVQIRETQYVTHNVRRFEVEKPTGFAFEPGQATDVSVDRDGWRDEQRPFTFTSLPEWERLQFTIKIYPDHEGVTEQLAKQKIGDYLLIEEPWGTINYKGRGTFIAGGAGVTPFISILRALQRDGELKGHSLIFSNKAERDIILRDEFDAMDELDKTYVLTSERNPSFRYGRIDKDFIRANIRDFQQYFYVCGPEEMVAEINDALKELGADPDGLVFEK